MNKLIYLAAAAALVGLASCGSGTKTDNGLDSIYSQAQVDSLFNVTGTQEGINAAKEFNFQAEKDSTLSKKEYINGFMYAISGDTAKSYVMGMQKGMQFASALNYYAQRGLSIDKQAFINSFRQAFMQEEVSDSATRALNIEVQKRWAEFQQAMEQYENAKMEASEESQSNIKRGEAYIKELVSKDASVKVESDGVAIKVDTLGTGMSLKDAGRVYLDLSGKTLDNKDVDNFTNRAVSINSLVPGLQSALRTLNVGTVATIYVPGKQAYGVNGRRYNLGPNEMIVYKVKVISLYDAAAEQAKGKKK